MASVKRRHDSRFWVMCYRMPTGRTDAKGRTIFRRVQRNSHLEDRGQALQLALSHERAANLAARQSFTNAAVQQFLREVNAITGAAPGETEIVEDFLRRWLKTRAGALAPESHRRYQDAVDLFLDFLGQGARGPIMSITPRTIAEFRDSEAGKGKGSPTVNKYLAILAQAFQEATTLGYFQQNPARGLNLRRSAAAARRSGPQRRPFTLDQVRQLVGKLAEFRPDEIPIPAGRRKYDMEARAAAAITAGDWLTLIMLCAYTGARQQEAAHLQWPMVDLGAGRLVLDRSKTADKHWIPLHPALLDHLTVRARRVFGKRRATGAVMPSLDRAPRRYVSNTFRRSILPLIGIKQDYGAAAGEGRQTAEYSLHSLRHSLATWLEAAGVSEVIRMRLVGHETEEVSRGYTHSDFAAHAAALAKVPALTATQGAS